MIEPFHPDGVMARTAQAATDSLRLKNLVETVRLMEAESAELLRTLEQHRKRDHGVGA